MTGHGGDNFLKFQDTEEINSHDLADALQQMHERRRYNQILLMIDTCQAATMHEHILAPGVTAIASSVRGESSYSYHLDNELGVAVLDRFTWALLEFTKELGRTSEVTLSELYKSLDPTFLHSHPHLLQTEGAVPITEARLVDFFGNLRHVHVGDCSIEVITSSQEAEIHEDGAWKKPFSIASNLKESFPDSHRLLLPVTLRDNERSSGAFILAALFVSASLFWFFTHFFFTPYDQHKQKSE